MVRPVGYVHHVVSFRPETLPKPVVKLFPLFPEYGKREYLFFPMMTFFGEVLARIYLLNKVGRNLKKKKEKAPPAGSAGMGDQLLYIS
jgi:hypothetical protein